ncbi:ion transporter [Flammeovirga pacifica]|uniref:ion transporter n=1 Tax=Flammeovirga pacifica TaxID=915059 RepID=UPI0005C62671|nr:ion transporter [Flammeovirga pacifica]
MKNLLLNNKFILALIIINAIVIFLTGFNFENQTLKILNWIDVIITGVFVAEITTKISVNGTKKYFSSRWNIFDFTLVILSLPTLAEFIFDADLHDISFLLVFRVARIFKSFRFLKFIPGIEQLLKGIERALRSSIIVLMGFVIYVFIVGVLSFQFFGNASPEHFGNPLISLYSIFKIFTVEGWYEIPESVVENYTPFQIYLTYSYFIFVVLSGGILGMSLVNSIFVDAMVADNNDDLEKKVEDLTCEIKDLKKILLNK